MPLQVIYYIAEMVVGVAVIISIVFVAIELRQNTYIVRKSMADQREEREDWLFKTLITNNELRQYHSRVVPEWDELNDDERLRAHLMGVSGLRPMLNELRAHFDGQISAAEFKSLEWNLKTVANRPNVQSAYEFLKDAYEPQVRQYFEALSKDSGTDFHKAFT